MQWRQDSKYHMESDCGRFRIAKVFTGTRAMYELWERDGGNWNWRAASPSAAVAKEIAESRAAA